MLNPDEADRASRNAALTLTLALPGDTVLYLLLPLHAAAFGVTLPEAGFLLAANRIVRVFGYRWVAAFYSTRGPRAACLLAAAGAVLSTLGYAVCSGVWLLLVARLIWGLAFAAMNIANQALPTSQHRDALQRLGRARSIVAVGPMAGLLVGGIVAELWGTRPVFMALAVIALTALMFAAQFADSAGAGSPAAPAIRRARCLQYLVVLHGVCARRPLRVRSFPLGGGRARQEWCHRRQRRHGASLCLGNPPVTGRRQAGAQMRCTADAGSTFIGNSRRWLCWEHPSHFYGSACCRL